MSDVNLSPPYTWRSYAELYRSLGWTGTLPLRAQTKWPPPTGYTGWEGGWPTPSDLEHWENEDYGPGAGMALRLPPNIVGIDVDAYGDKVGARSLADLIEAHGELPPTWTSTSRVDGVSAIRFYRVPPGLAWPGQAGRDIETIHFGHRYAVVYPSIHPTGSPYLWYSPEGKVSPPPKAGELPMLPDAWVEGLTRGEEATPARKAKVDTDAWEWVMQHQAATDPCRCVVEFHPELTTAAERGQGSAHEAVRDRLVPAVRLAERGCSGVTWLLNDTLMAFMDTVDRPDSEAEFDRMLAGAVAIVVADPQEGRCQDFGRIVGDVVYEPSASPSRDADGFQIEGPEEWGRLNLVALLSGSAPEPPRPALLTRTDGPALFYPGTINGLYGEPGGGKTWVALAAVQQTVAAGHRAVYVDIDGNGWGSLTSRLSSLGMDPLGAARDGLLEVWTPSDKEDVAMMVDFLCREVAPGIVVVDSLGELGPMVGLSTDDNDDVTHLMRLYARPLAERGAAVILIDHVAKAKESRGKFAIGAQAKKRRTDGAYIEVDVTEPFAPGRGGAANLLVSKDRHGAVLQHSVALTATRSSFGTFHLNEADEWRVEPPMGVEGARPEDSEQRKVEELRESVSSWLWQRRQDAGEDAEAAWASGRTVRDSVPGASRRFSQVLSDLTLSGHIESRPLGNRGTLYRGLKVYSRQQIPTGSDWFPLVPDGDGTSPATGSRDWFRGSPALAGNQEPVEGAGGSETTQDEGTGSGSLGNQPKSCASCGATTAMIGSRCAPCVRQEIESASDGTLTGGE